MSRRAEAQNTHVRKAFIGSFHDLEKLQALLRSLLDPRDPLGIVPALEKYQVRIGTVLRLQQHALQDPLLLLSIAIAERMNSPLLLQQLAPIKRKIVAAFSERYQSRIGSLRKRVLIGSPASEQVLASFSPPPPRALAGIAEAFFNMRCVSIDYVDQNGVTTSRDIEPQFLYLSLPVWYLLAWDRLRGAVRYFRIDRIKSVKPLDVSFRLADPRPFLAEAEAGIAAL